MSLLQDATLLRSTTHNLSKSPTKSITSPGKQQDVSQALHHSSPIAALVHLVRNPVAVVGEAVGGWYDGLTLEDRERRQAIEDRKHILYLKLRAVSLNQTHTCIDQPDH